MRKILILTTELTGYGHKTVSDAITHNFKKYKNVDVRSVESFSFGGKVEIALSQLYNKSVLLNLKLWEFIYKVNSLTPYPLGIYMGLRMEKKFLKYLEAYQPDFILSVQPVFVKSTAFVLAKNKISIPFGVLVTDIASINSCWLDKKPDIYFCTTEETKDHCLKYGISSDKIKMVKYPIGEQYATKGVLMEKIHGEEDPLKVLLLSGGDGVLNFETISRNILTNFHSQVTVVTGRNHKLKAKLQASLGKEFNKRISILGFVSNLSELYKTHDIAAIRASPNVMFEALLCNIPSIIVSYIPGQETDNCDFAVKHHIALKCLDEDKLVETIRALTADNRKKLAIMKQQQRSYIKSISYSDIEDILYHYDIDGAKINT